MTVSGKPPTGNIFSNKRVGLHGFLLRRQMLGANAIHSVFFFGDSIKSGFTGSCVHVSVHIYIVHCCRCNIGYGHQVDINNSNNIVRIA